ncbi:hypothetical protein FHS38_006603 [Streptomyces netropsis]|uniref:Carboxylesterase family protein n=2 Tax=Streptomyces netropsis TaxID=55404 RepID=A0A7W7LIX3_STRNE|nr:hypothetical protein [Streptomyces netropsis]
MDALSHDAVGDDWLTVNVWSPEPGPGAGLPVMVWIQGGAYRSACPDCPSTTVAGWLATASSW